MHKRGISLFLHLLIRIWVLLANSTPGAICYCTPGQSRTATGVPFNLGHCYWSPSLRFGACTNGASLFYGYTAGYLAWILRLEYRSTRFWASIYGSAIVKIQGGYYSLFLNLPNFSNAFCYAYGSITY